MARSKKHASRKLTAGRVGDSAFVGALTAMTSQGTGSGNGAAGRLPGDIQMQVDVHVCLLDAMTDNLPIKRSEIGSKTVPGDPPIGADEQGWGTCLAAFGDFFRQLRTVYSFYVHKPRYTSDTIDKPFPDIVLYLKQNALAQFKGDDE